MCGIFGYIGSREQAASLVLEGLKQLEYRGYDSWGVAVAPSAGKTISLKKKTGKIGDGSVQDLPAGTLAFGHTRWATHGGVTEANAHPLLDCSGQVAVIHNGIFENYETFKNELLSQGHTFSSETDTEVIVHLIEEYLKKLPFFEAVRNTFLDLEGLNAFVAINIRERVLVAVRRGSPLVLGFGVGENYLASDPAALLPHTKDVYFLEDQEMAVVTDTEIKIFDSLTAQEKKATKQHLTWDVSQTEKGEYAHYMLKEIHEQPQIVATIAVNATRRTQEVADYLQQFEDIYLIGCGSASYASQVGYYLFSKIAHRQVNCSVGSEFSYNLEAVTSKTLLLALSQSGETMDLLEPLKMAKTKGAKILALVNVLGSSLYRLADEKVLLTAGPERAVASTKAFTAKLAHLILLAFAAADELEAGKALLTQAAESASSVLLPTSLNHIQGLATRLKDTQHIYCLGRGISFPLSLETALKIKEISYIHAEGLAMGELKHGTLALIEKGVPCLAFLPNDETYAASLAGVMEVKARGGYVVGVSFKPHAIFDYYIEVLDVKEATIIPNVIVAQLLAYYLTLERKLDPDMPRNLAKSVTVK